MALDGYIPDHNAGRFGIVLSDTGKGYSCNLFQGGNIV